MRFNSKNKWLFSIVLGIFILLSGCGINSSLMFKIPKDSNTEGSTVKSDYYKIYKKDSVPLIPMEDYKIAADDKFTFTLNTNDGQRILEGMSGTSNTPLQNNTVNQFEYIVRPDGKALLPIVGEVKLVGLTEKESEDTLKQMFSKFYLNPFVQLRVTNRRVIVFPGDGGAARVVYIKNNNTTLMEVIAEVGGISERGKSKSIKLMRSIAGKREIYPIDLSTIEGLIYADMIVQSNDYIYIEPNAKLGREALAQASPFLALVSTILVVFTVFNNLK